MKLAYPLLALSLLVTIGCDTDSGGLGNADASGTDATAGPDAGFVQPADIAGNEVLGWDYLIVTNEVMKPAYDRLAEWRRRTGLPAHVVTMADVVMSTEGRDTAEQLRTYIRGAVRDRDTKIVLLGGDTPMVPHRMVPVHVLITGVFEHDSDAAADLYFSDLDGTWDKDGDNIFAEWEDEPDLYPDVAVGRVPSRTLEQAETYVDKVIAYESATDAEHLSDVLFLSEPTGYGGIDSAYQLDQWTSSLFGPEHDIEKLYAAPDPYPDAVENTLEDQVAAINEGKGIVVHLGHGSTGFLAYMRRDDVNALHNAPYYNVFFSCACSTGDFTVDDKGSLGEVYVLSEAGGGVAYIGNTDVGMGFPSGSFFLEAMISRLVHHDTFMRIGEAFTEARMTYINGGPGSSFTELSSDRYTQFVVVLLGDPGLHMWERAPDAVTLDAPASANEGAEVAVTVLEADGSPAVNATVAFYQPGRVLVYDRTNLDGTASLPADATVLGPLYVTVSGRHLIPAEATVAVE